METTPGPSVQLTPDALIKALELQKEHPEWQGLNLRLYIEGKGCDGFYYGVTFDQRSPEDGCFTAIGPTGQVDMVIDPQTLQFVDGSTIIWVDDERGKGFLVENPKHRSYRGKFYKRPSWVKALQASKEAQS